MKHNRILWGPTVLFFAYSAPGQEAIPKRGSAPIYNVTVVERTTKAINYQYRSGPTVVDFRGTVLMPKAKGQATVESKRGRTEIDVSVDNLQPPARFGREYLTYTLWAITPEGAPRNLGEVIPNGSDKARLRVTTDLQAFGLIVTAEPYSAARQPSDVVVMENQVRPETIGTIKDIEARYELMPRGHYTLDRGGEGNSSAAGLPKVSQDRYEAVLELYEAQNAAGIARAAGAERYASQTLERAQQLLANAQQLHDHKGNTKVVVQLAREAAQTAEDARTIAEKRRQEEQVATLKEESAKAQRAQARAEAAAQTARAEADAARSQAEAERSARQRAESEAADAHREVAETAPIAAPPAAAPLPAVAQPPADSHKTELRKRLLEQLSGVLTTRDTPRGLVVTVADSDFSGTVLRAPVAGRIGRVTPILEPYSQLHVVVEGYSDSTATESLAWKRAENVQRALVGHGLPAGRSEVRGLGDARPLVSNSRVTGREQNRRVEIVISGDAIGSLPNWDRTYSLVQQR